MDCLFATFLLPFCLSMKHTFNQAGNTRGKIPKKKKKRKKRDKKGEEASKARKRQSKVKRTRQSRTLSFLPASFLPPPLFTQPSPFPSYFSSLLPLRPSHPPFSFPCSHPSRDQITFLREKGTKREQINIANKSFPASLSLSLFLSLSFFLSFSLFLSLLSSPLLSSPLPSFSPPSLLFLVPLRWSRSSSLFVG